MKIDDDDNEYDNNNGNGHDEKSHETNFSYYTYYN
jgi:hypothetical protein